MRLAAKKVLSGQQSMLAFYQKTGTRKRAASEAGDEKPVHLSRCHGKAARKKKARHDGPTRTATPPASSTTTTANVNTASRLAAGATATAANPLLVASSPPVPTCDLQDSEKPNMVTDYVEDLYNYYKERERERSPTMYVHKQTDINARMRAILINWLVEVHLKFKLVPSTLYLCVTLIDQYCTVNQVSRSKLQLVGVTALFIACKYEEIYPPEVKDCVYITDHAYTREEVLEMEMEMLRFFGYNISVPTCYQFLVRFLRIAGYNTSSRVAFRASYFSERCLQEHEMLSYKPSLIAASAVYLATSMEKDAPWHRQLREYAGYTLNQILPCARQISEHVNKIQMAASRRLLHAVLQKFESPRFMEVALEHVPVL